ncbi:hypothetical protein [Erwinia tracheiphila]
MVHLGCWHACIVTPAVLAQIAITPEYSFPAYFPMPNITTFVPALARLIPLPTVASMQLTVSCAMTTTIVCYRSAATIAAGAITRGGTKHIENKS